MAISKSNMQLEGLLANVTMYKMHGSDKVNVRSKGGITKDQILMKPQFENLRFNKTNGRAVPAWEAISAGHS